MGMVERYFSLEELKEKQKSGYAWFISQENLYEFLTEKEKVKRQSHQFFDNLDEIIEEEEKLLGEDEEFDIVEIFKNWIENDDLYNSLEETINTLEALEG